MIHDAADKRIGRSQLPPPEPNLLREKALGRPSGGFYRVMSYRASALR